MFMLPRWVSWIRADFFVTGLSVDRSLYLPPLYTKEGLKIIKQSWQIYCYAFSPPPIHTHAGTQTHACKRTLFLSLKLEDRKQHKSSHLNANSFVHSCSKVLNTHIHTDVHGDRKQKRTTQTQETRIHSNPRKASFPRSQLSNGSYLHT